MSGRRSFSRFLVVHRRIKRLFRAHQLALISLDLRKAKRLLEQFEWELLDHIRVEEQYLLPIYRRAGDIPGGPEIFFTGEHRALRRFIANFKQIIRRYSVRQGDIRKGVLAILDREAMFKGLLHHHDLRERNILYPALDRVATEAERRQFLSERGGA
ncbi:MAG: hypothetical protein A2Z34_08775 [Planctomycetes bacterium RBG_16_59_8]|nr:MAG: hypothetical protein A2Z34_08775 [Planctomycetes bacterium RBG_16_59_8]